MACCDWSVSPGDEVGHQHGLAHVADTLLGVVTVLLPATAPGHMQTSDIAYMSDEVNTVLLPPGVQPEQGLLEEGGGEGGGAGQQLAQAQGRVIRVGGHLDTGYRSEYSGNNNE